MEFHVRLRQLAKGMGVREVAEVAGVGKTTAANWLRGVTQPKIDEAVKLAQHFGVSLDDLAGLESPTRPVARSPAIDALLAVMSEDEAIRRLAAVPVPAEVRVTIRPNHQESASKRSG